MVQQATKACWHTHTHTHTQTHDCKLTHDLLWIKLIRRKGSTNFEMWTSSGKCETCRMKCRVKSPTHRVKIQFRKERRFAQQDNDINVTGKAKNLKTPPREGVFVCVRQHIFTNSLFLLERSAFGLQCRVGKIIFYATQSLKKLVYTDYTVT